MRAKKNINEERGNPSSKSSNEPSFADELSTPRPEGSPPVFLFAKGSVFESQCLQTLIIMVHASIARGII